MEDERRTREFSFDDADIFLPKHLCGPEPTWSWGETYTKSLYIKAMQIAFYMTEKEAEICNQVANLDLLWRPSNADDYSAVDVIFGEGDKYGVEAEFIRIVISYMFQKCDDDYAEPYDHPNEVLLLIDSYKKRMRSKYPTAIEWLMDVLSLKMCPTNKKTSNLAREICDYYELEKKWSLITNVS